MNDIEFEDIISGEIARHGVAVCQPSENTYSCGYLRILGPDPENHVAPNRNQGWGFDCGHHYFKRYPRALDYDTAKEQWLADHVADLGVEVEWEKVV